MARANTPTLLSLDRWAEIIGIDPRHFNQIVCEAFPADSACDDIWYQYGWMLGEKASREDLARAIAQAERMIAQFLGWWPAPIWSVSEPQTWPAQRVVWGGSYGIASRHFIPGHFKRVKTNWGRVIRGGRETWSLLASNVAVTYSDPYTIGFDDLASVTTAYDATTHSGLVGSEVRLVPTGTITEDLVRLQIRGLSVVLTAPNTLDIEGGASKFLDPALWENPDAADGDVAANFLDHVDVYRRWTSDQGNSNAPVEFGTELWCPPDASAACDVSVSYGCIMVVKPLTGIIAPVPATWGSANTWVRSNLCGEPDEVRLWYLSGYPWDDWGEMSHPLDRAVAALATALLQKPVCGCENESRLVFYWQQTPANLTVEQAECPFGAQNGAYQAWLTVSQMAGLDGVSVG